MLIFSSEGTFYYNYVLLGWYKGLIYMENWKVIRQLFDQNPMIDFIMASWLFVKILSIVFAE